MFILQPEKIKSFAGYVGMLCQGLGGRGGEVLNSYNFHLYLYLKLQYCISLQLIATFSETSSLLLVILTSLSIKHFLNAHYHHIPQDPAVPEHLDFQYPWDSVTELSNCRCVLSSEAICDAILCLFGFPCCLQLYFTQCPCSVKKVKFDREPCKNTEKRDLFALRLTL